MVDYITELTKCLLVGIILFFKYSFRGYIAKTSEDASKRGIVYIFIV